MTKDVFSVQIFFILFRETLEASIIVSVLLAFLKQGLGQESNNHALYKRLVWQVWIGAALGIFICLVIGGGFIGAFYSLGKDIWSSAEDLWEGIFSIIATVLITVMGLAMLRINKMKEKWRVKIAQALIDSDKNRGELPWYKLMNPVLWTKKYAIAVLPFITCLREGLEAVVFIGGVSLGTSATAFPLPVICGLLAGCLCGYVIYRGGNYMSIQIFLIASTCFVYLIGAGLFSRAVWYFEMYVFSQKAGGDVAEMGSGPGSYKVSSSVWHVNCCNPETDNGWMIFNALFGWQNSATYGSVISYNVYWIFVSAVFILMWYEEKTGHFPFLSGISKKLKKELTEAEREDLFRRANEVAANYGKKKNTNTEAESLSSSDNIDIEKEPTQTFTAKV
ncbi:uncharacterized protein SAPINGB_P003279 [Magnusiomyces paraingens]|uniref:Plasma membrane iron permease n=1 Tax=Magnusiomyces paraingens TaxID=2606893 RepID=A0A5E8BR42_9ASCO|nr:uncharacterized protein SAPINGB_P003279 [Saprochaete ingens]VVT51987.1 unnamed protein product [Saprochaete ingens]